MDWNHRVLQGIDCGEQNLCSPNLYSYIVFLWQRDFTDIIEISDHLTLKLGDYSGLAV